MTQVMQKLFKETECYYWVWEAVFDRYKKVKVIDYCKSCGQEKGSHTEERGVKLLRYDLKKHKKDMLYNLSKGLELAIKPLIDDQILNTPTLYERFFK